MNPLLTQPELDALATVAVKAAQHLGYTERCDIGHVYQRERIALLADRCCQNGPGDLIEIGVYQGGTSVILAEIARRHGRKLYCIDNFAGGDDFHLDRIEPVFLKAIEPWRDVAIFLKIDAHLPESVKIIQERRYCFGFSDDGHAYEHHVSELSTLLPVVDGLLCADDVYFPGVMEALRDTVPRFPGWRILEAAPLSEAWIMKVPDA